ncbi:MAG: hypothetical protein JST54_28265 [Deltaproteobacteria bacterium]|nr:hypothetical protein [Deltaproteobacteria bacterium]
MIAAVIALGIVVGDGASLRAAPKDSAPLSAPLAPGDALELRGERAGFLQVYDHRRERGGYVRRAAVRELGSAPEDAPGLLAVVRFLRDTPGEESVGIGYVAAYLRAAPANAIGAEAFDALGGFAERLGRHASRRSDKPDDPKLALQLDAAQAYGVRFASIEREGRVELCYDGEAYRRVLAQSPTAEQAAHAALGLTRSECVDPDLTPPARLELDRWRADVLGRVDAAALPAWLAGKVHIRRAAVSAALAYSEERGGDAAAAKIAGEKALSELALANPVELADDDQGAYADAAARVGASRWASESSASRTGGLVLQTHPGEAGETCLRVARAKTPEQPLVERCTHALVWTASARSAPHDSALAVAVQPTDSWRELWIFRETSQGWVADVLTPAAADPGVGYVELAGFTPDGKHVLTAREARAGGHKEREFALLDLETLAVEKKADHPEAITAFARWQSAEWKATTVAIR